MIVSIVHPSVLILTKLKCWMEHGRGGDTTGFQGYHQRTRTDLADIVTILRWLERNRQRINLSGLPQVPKSELLSLLASGTFRPFVVQCYAETYDGKNCLHCSVAAALRHLIASSIGTRRMCVHTLRRHSHRRNCRRSSTRG